MSYRAIVRSLVAGLIIGAGACHDEGPIVPNPGPRAVDGGWVVAFGPATGGGETCHFSSMRLSLTIGNGNGGGQYDPEGLGYCEHPPFGATEEWAFAQFYGTGSDSTIDFTLHSNQPQPPSTFEFHLAGHLRNDSMIGTYSRSVTGFPGGPLLDVIGTWRAARMPSTSASIGTIRLHPTVVLVAEQDSVQLVDTVFDATEQALSVQPPVSYALSDPTLATISPAGWLHGTSHPGTLLISVRAAGAFAQVVAVVTPHPDSLRFTPNPMVLNRDESSRLVVTGRYHGDFQIAGLPLSFSSSDTALVQTYGAGYLTSPDTLLGHAWIRARGLGFNDSVAITIISAPANFTMTPPWLLVQPGAHDQLVVQATDSAGLPFPNPSVAYYSDNPSVIGVSATGRVTALGPLGFATIHASLADVTRETRVLARSDPVPAVTSQGDLIFAPEAMAVSTTGIVYSVGNGILAAGSMASRVFHRVQQSCGFADGVAFDPAGARVFISCQSPNEILAIDVATEALVDSVLLGPDVGPLGLVMSHDGRTLVVATNVDLRFYDPTSLALRKSIVFDGGASVLALDPVLPVLYACTDSLLRIDLDSLRIIGAVTHNSGCARLIVSPDGVDLFLVSNTGLNILDPVSGIVKDSVPGIPGITDLAMAGGSDLIYALHELNDSVTVIDRRSRVPIARLSIRGPRHLAIDPTGIISVIGTDDGKVFFLQ